MHQDIITLLKDIQNLPVLCVGDIMLDRYVYGQATRISPEAPVPVVEVKKTLITPGGVGNVTRNLSTLGVNAFTVTLTGDDYNANLLSDIFKKSGWAEPLMIKDPARPTIVKTRIVAGIQQVVRFDEEDLTPPAPLVAQAILDAVEKKLPEVKAAALSDYGKGVLTPQTISRIIGLAKAAGLPVVVDPKGRDYSKYAGATLVTPNRQELSEAVGAERIITAQDDLVTAGQALMAKTGIENLLITRSEEGMTLLRSGHQQDPIHLPSLARKVFDVSGAGDTVVAMMTAALAAGAPLFSGAGLANLAAGVVVGKVGTAAAEAEEIEAAILAAESI